MKQAMLACLLTLAACGSTSAPSSQPSAPAGKPELDHVKLVYATASGEDTFAELASSKGFFQKYGLTADVQYAQSSTAMAAITSGEAQMALADGVLAVEGIATGTPYKVVGYFDKTSPYMIASLPDVPNAADLKGKTIAVGKLGDTSDVSMRIGLRSSGLVPGKDFSILQVGNSPARWAALSTKQVAAAILDEDAYRKQAEGQGMHILVSMHSQNLPYVAPALLLSDSFAKANPKTIVAVLRGLIDGTKYMADPKNRGEVTAAMAKQLRMGPGDPQLAAVYDAYANRAAQDPYPDKAGIQTILGALKDEDPNLYGKLTAEQVVDGTFMDNIRHNNPSPTAVGEAR